MHMQTHSEHDTSHVESGDDPHSTAHQDVPVVEPVKDAVPSQSLETTVSNMLAFSSMLIV